MYGRTSRFRRNTTSDSIRRQALARVPSSRVPSSRVPLAACPPVRATYRRPARFQTHPTSHSARSRASPPPPSASVATARPFAAHPAPVRAVPKRDHHAPPCPCRGTQAIGGYRHAPSRAHPPSLVLSTQPVDLATHQSPQPRPAAGDGSITDHSTNPTKIPIADLTLLPDGT